MMALYAVPVRILKLFYSSLGLIPCSLRRVSLYKRKSPRRLEINARTYSM